MFGSLTQTEEPLSTAVSTDGPKFVLWNLLEAIMISGLKMLENMSCEILVQILPYPNLSLDSVGNLGQPAHFQDKVLELVYNSQVF